MKATTTTTNPLSASASSTETPHPIRQPQHQQQDNGAQSLLRLASQEDADAQHRLARAYDKGLRGLPKDSRQALHWWTQAAKHHHFAKAQYCLGCCYQNGIVEHSGGTTTTILAQDWAQAVHWYKKAAAQGHVCAQHNLAWCWEHGKGVAATDLGKAMELYQLAAHQGLAAAQFSLGVCLETNHNSSRSLSSSSSSLLSSSSSVSCDTAVHWYEQAAQQGFAEAQYCLGRCLEHGQGGATSVNLHKAVQWYQRAADQDHFDAQQVLVPAKVRLAKCLQEGLHGCKIDRNQATALFRDMAAEPHNNADAQFALAQCYQTGRGVAQQDWIQAADWYRKAAVEQHHEEAQAQLQAWLVELNAKAHHPDNDAVLQVLAHCYKHGIGVPKDVGRAQHFLQRSSSSFSSSQHEEDSGRSSVGQQQEKEPSPKTLQSSSPPLQRNEQQLQQRTTSLDTQQPLASLFCSDRSSSISTNSNHEIAQPHDENVNRNNANNPNSKKLHFLSHSGRNKSIALCVARLLQSHGHDYWLDVLHCKDKNQDAIYSAIAACDCVVALVSQCYLDSAWCMKELGYAEGSRTPIVCLRLEPPAHGKDMFLKAHPGTSTRSTSVASEVYELFDKFLDIGLTDQELHDLTQWIHALQTLEEERPLEYSEIRNFVRGDFL